jgi:membrane protein YqaA with SNARE-associated domain
MLRSLYDWIMRLAASRHALSVMAAVSFVESSFFPIPPDAMLVPMVLARPDRAWRIAAVCTVASVLGGLLGYAIGYYAYEALGSLVVSAEDYETYRAAYAEYGLWVILVKGLTPIPYKLVTIASGVAQFDLTVFVLASIVTRGARFFIVTALLRIYGEPIRHFIEKYLTWVTTGFVLLIVGGILAVKYVH